MTPANLLEPGTVPLGASFSEDGRCLFQVWAPLAQQVEVHIVGPEDRLSPMARDDMGYYSVGLRQVQAGSLYYYRLNGELDRPDPASRFQPRGVHGPSEVVEPDYPWTDGRWRGLPLRDYVIYELHVGTFTPEGSFDAIIPRLDELKELGVTAVELMPAAQFPGQRNWGYDGVDLFAVQNSYGGPQGLKRLVDACHRRKLAVVLDVVYNHLGPEGNYLPDFAPFFTDRYRTGWGPALNFDGAGSDQVRRFFIENALYWTFECHIDALRLDAVHTILDRSPHTFLEELAETVHSQARKVKRRVHLIAESSANDRRLVRRPSQGGYGLDCQWNDDFHHALHTLLTGENAGYYVDYGGLQHLTKAMGEGFVYSGEYSKYRGRRHGTSSKAIASERLVVFSQNHDQVGNRMLGERLSTLVSFEALKLAAGLVLLSPYIPLLFMGEEYGEVAPFQYFVSHSQPGLIDAVRGGRKREFALFGWQEETPDPQDEATFEGSKLKYELRNDGRHRLLREFYRELLALRKKVPALGKATKAGMAVSGCDDGGGVLHLIRRSAQGHIVAAFNLGQDKQLVTMRAEPGSWSRLLDSADECWGGPGSVTPQELRSAGQVCLEIPPQTFVVLVQTGSH